MDRAERQADPYQIFTEEHGIASYEALVKKYPELKDHTVEFLATRAVYEAMSKISHLETRELNPELAARALASAISERTLMPTEISRHDDVAHITLIEDKDEQAEQDRAERIYHASLDPRIVECILSGEEKDMLIVQLQTDYDLTEEEARGIIRDVGYKAREVVDYGDEA